MSDKASSLPAALNEAFAALETYDRGSSRGALLPIDEAVNASLGDAGLRKDLEQRLAAVLAAKVSAVAKEYVCGKLGLIGSAESVPALSELLAEPDLAHAAQSALASIPCDESLQAIRNRLPKLSGLAKVGAINCLGMRRDAQSLPVLAAMLAEPDGQIRLAALAALGNIGTLEAAKALQAFEPNADAATKLALADALLACAERLLAAGKKDDSSTIYKSLTDAGQPRHVRLAAKRGLLTIQTR